MFRIANAASTISVELSHNGVSRRFALSANDDRGILVGSTRLAHFHINSDRIAPVHFYLERRDDCIWLIAADGIRDLRLNDVDAIEAMPLEQHNVIEFGGFCMRALVLKPEADAERADQLTHMHAISQFGPSYTLELPSEHDVTLNAMQPFRIAAKPSEAATTTMMPRERLVHTSSNEPSELTTQHFTPYRPLATPAMTETGTVIMAPYRQTQSSHGATVPALTENGTEIMAPYRLAAPSPAAKAVEPHQPPHPASQWQPAPVPSNARILETRQVWPPHTSVATNSAPPSIDSSIALHTSDIPAQEPPRSEGSHGVANTARTATRPHAFAPRISVLARLGLLATARPLLVTCGATLGAALLAVLPFVLTQVLHHIQPAAKTITTTLRGLQPATASPGRAPRTGLNALESSAHNNP